MYAAFRYSSPKAVLHLRRSFAVGDPELPRKNCGEILCNFRAYKILQDFVQFTAGYKVAAVLDNVRASMLLSKISH